MMKNIIDAILGVFGGIINIILGAVILVAVSIAAVVVIPSLLIIGFCYAIYVLCTLCGLIHAEKTETEDEISEDSKSE